MELEDLTKEELLRLIKSRWWPQPTHRDIISAHWDRLTGESSRIMAQANEESEKWIGLKTMEALQHWHDAQLLFNKGMKLADEAETVFKELMETRD